MLEEKLDLLTKEMVALRKAIEENTAAGGSTSSGKPSATSSDEAPSKPKRGRPKAETPEPEHTAEEVEAIIRRVSREVGKPAAQTIIKKTFKCEDLADLLTHPEHFDAAYAAAEEALPQPEAAAEEEEDDI